MHHPIESVSRRTVQFVTSLLLASSLAACGGGGGGGGKDSPQSPVPPSGVINPELIVVAGSGETAASGADAAASATKPAASVASNYVYAAYQSADFARQKAQSRIGVNVAVPVYFTRTHEFYDLMRQSAGFGIPDTPWKDPASVGRGPIALDPADGYPTEDFAVIVMSAQTGVVGLGGRYTLVFTGAPNAVVSIIASQASLSAPRTEGGYTVIDVDFKEGANQLILNFKNTGGTLKNLHLYRPLPNGLKWNSPNIPTFTEHYIQHLAPFSTIRFMDWLGSNSVHEAKWANRLTPKNAPLGFNGNVTPGRTLEDVVALAKTAKTNVWINVPSTADEEYYAKLAQFLKANLDSNQIIYLEYGNEFWNALFPQYQWLINTAVPAEIAAGNTALAFDGATNKMLLGARLYGERLMRISKAFRAEFGDQAFTDRVRPVLAWQSSGAGYIEEMFNHIKRLDPARPVSYYVHGMATAPYMQLGAKQKLEGLTVSELLDALDTAVTDAPYNYKYERLAFLSKKYNVNWVSYEGGPDTAGSGSIEAKAQTNRDPRILDNCKRLLNGWSQGGGGMFMWYLAGATSWVGNYGSWTLEEFLTNDTVNNPSYKSQCMKWAANTPAPKATSRHVPGKAFDAAETAGSYFAVDTSEWRLARNWYAVGQEKEYVISPAIEATGNTCYILSASSKFGQSGQFDIDINGRNVLKAATVLPADGSGTPVMNDLGKVCLDPGVNVLTLKMVGVANGQLHELALRAAP
jgi:hypothetical protein